MLKLYRIQLKNSLVPATDPENAFYSHLELQGNMAMDSFNIAEIVPEEHTFKLLNTARMLIISDKFHGDEVVAMVEALADRMGYFLAQEDIRDLICRWVERFDETEDDEFLDWLNR